MQGRFATRVLYRRAMRKASLSAEEQKTLNEIMERDEWTDVADEAIDDLPRKRDGRVRAIGDGTILALLIEHLPEIIAAIIEIIKAMSGGTVSAQAVGLTPAKAMPAPTTAAPKLGGRKRRKARRQKRRAA